MEKKAGNHTGFPAFWGTGGYVLSLPVLDIIQIDDLFR